MSVCSGAASSGRHSNADRPGLGEGDVAASGRRPVVPSHHPGQGWTHHPAVCVQHHWHQAGRSGHPPMFRISDSGVLIQHVPGAERAHKIHVHHQQWVSRARVISITWWLWSRSAILSEAFLSDMQNMILRGKKDPDARTTYLLLRLSRKH